MQLKSRMGEAQRAHQIGGPKAGQAPHCPSGLIVGVRRQTSDVRQKAFTLVEILVVLVILGLAATFTTLGFQRLEDDRLTKQAGHLSGWLQQLSDSAMLDGAVYGARFDDNSRRLESSFYFNNRWWRMSGENTASEKLAGNLTLVLETDGREPDLSPPVGGGVRRQVPDILFLPSGLSLPETLRLEADDGRAAVVRRDPDGLYTWSLDR